MRHWIDLFESDFSGSWIEPDGTTHLCNHETDEHHANLAATFFADAIGHDGSNIDELSKHERAHIAHDALNLAVDSGWLQITHITWSQPHSFAVCWRGRLTRAQIKKCEEAILQCIEAGTRDFSIAHDDFFGHTTDAEEFLAIWDKQKRLA